jgi:hypothetical protein
VVTPVIASPLLVRVEAVRVLSGHKVAQGEVLVVFH